MTRFPRGWEPVDYFADVPLPVAIISIAFVLLAVLI